MTTSIPTNINTCYNNIINETDKYYVFIATPDTAYIPTSVYDDVIMSKRVSASDISYGIIRYDWVYGNVYSQYNYTDYTSGVLKSKNFYVNVFSGGEYHVYKCINNNQGKPSTISPSTINREGVVTLSDGYTWIYMYSISIVDFNKFASNSYIPCKNQISTYIPDSSGSINNIQMVHNGYGYTTCTAIISGNGSGATAVVELINGTVGRVDVSFGGVGYTEATISFIGDGSGAVAIPVISPDGGQSSNALSELYATYLLLSVNISTHEDYSVVPYGVVYNSYGLIGGIQFNNYSGDSEVDYVKVLNGGTGFYPSSPLPTITFSDGFETDQITNDTDIPASAYASMGSNLTKVIMTNNGKNYRNIATASSTNGIVLQPIMKSTPLQNFISLNVNNTNLKFSSKETIKQGSTTAQVLFQNDDVIGVYNVSGTFVGNMIVEGLSSGASAVTLSINYLNSQVTNFDNTNLLASYQNSPITRQENQPEQIIIVLSF